MHHYCKAESAWDEADARVAKTSPIVAEQQGGDFCRVAVPVYHMAMPITADGNGPASPEETVGHDHEVWDQLCRTLCRCSCAEDAVLIAKAINAFAGASTPTNLATAYYLAAEWHDKQAAACRDVANDDPRIDATIRTKAAQAAIHHGASAAGLRLAATQIRRAATD